MEDWYKVENLQEMQIFRKEMYENGERDNQNDFDSYRMLNEGRADSGISNHNATGRSAKNLAVVIKKIVMGIPDLCLQPLKIADFGGGGRISCGCNCK